LQFLKILGYKKIFGINVSPVAELSQPIPLGLTNSTNESELHTIFGNHNLLKIANETEPFPEKFKGKVFGNFSISTNKKERSALASLLQKSGNVYQDPNLSPEGRIEFLSKLRRFGFVACPVGNGIDTHRVWETLYMGGVPIVLRNPIVEELLKDLPHLVVTSWKEIASREFLEREWNRTVTQKTYNYRKLDINYLITQIHS
jgi:hypothetical protein